MDINEIKQFIEENKDNAEVIGVLSSYVPQEITPEAVENFLNEDEQRAWGLLQPRFDKQFEKSLNTWKNNHLQDIIETEIRKRNPDETPEAKRIRQLEERLAAQDQERKRAESRAIATSYCARYGLPESVVDAIMGESEEIIRTKAQRLEMDYKSAIETEIEKRMSKGYRPRGTSSDKTPEQAYEEARKKGDPMAILNAKFAAR